MHAVDTTKEVLGGFKDLEIAYAVDTTKEVLGGFWDLAELAAGRLEDRAASATRDTRLDVVSTPNERARVRVRGSTVSEQSVTSTYLQIYYQNNSATARVPETLVAEPVARPTSSPWRCRLAATPKARIGYLRV